MKYQAWLNTLTFPGRAAQVTFDDYWFQPEGRSRILGDAWAGSSGGGLERRTHSQSAEQGREIGPGELPLEQVRAGFVVTLAAEQALFGRGEIGEVPRGQRPVDTSSRMDSIAASNPIGLISSIRRTRPSPM